MQAPIVDAHAAPFDASRLRYNGFLSRLTRWGFDHLRPIYKVVRAIRPNIRVFGWVIATRREDVEAILLATKSFHVRFGTRLAALHPRGIAPFGLGTEGATHDDTLKRVSNVMVMEDLPRITAILRDFVAIETANATEIDLGSLALRTQAHLGRCYLGLAVDDKALQDFALWCVAVGNYAFGPQKSGSTNWHVGRGAAARLAAMMRVSFDQAVARPDTNTLIGRMVKAGFTPPEIDASLTGLLSALVPASAQAIINAAQVLLARPEAMAAAVAAAQTRDDPGLERVLLEAVRFKPIFLGPFRDCKKEHVIGAGRFGSVRARPGDLVVPVIEAAMFDPGRVGAPDKFDPSRPASDGLVFGLGTHSCFGFAVGRVQLVETLKPLVQSGFRQTKADKAAVSYFGTLPERFPVHLW